MRITQLKTNAAILAAAFTITVGCKKESDQSTTENSNLPNATRLAELTISQEFNWSSSLKGKLDVTISSKDDIYTEGEPVQIVTKTGEVLDQAVVKDGVASFYIHLPQATEAYIYYPNTLDSKPLTKTGKVTLELTSWEDIENGKTKSSPIVPKKAATATSVNLLGNSDFSDPLAVIHDVNFERGPQAGPAVDGKWHIRYPNYNLSNQQLNFIAGAENSIPWGQTIDVVGGSSYTITSVWQMFSRHIVITWYNASNLNIGSMTNIPLGPVVGGQWNGTVPANTVKAQIHSGGSPGDYLDDLVFISTPTIIDADKDGIADNLDQFPNDATRAYQSSFPTLGNQYLAFEDLWPSKGDYDFNDMAIKNKVVYTKNAQNYLVDATFTIDLNAVGAGIHNGLGVVLLNTNKQPLANNVISSISGDATANANLQNGIVVFDDAIAAQSTYYTNTGNGPSATPDQFTFTVTFAPNTVSSIVPDLYIFRRDDSSHEIHLDGFSATALANTNLMNTGDDYNGTYNTENGLPWAIEVVTANQAGFRHPLEKTDILVAYPMFQVWAESNGVSNILWFESPVAAQVY